MHLKTDKCTSGNVENKMTVLNFFILQISVEKHIFTPRNLMKLLMSKIGHSRKLLLQKKNIRPLGSGEKQMSNNDDPSQNHIQKDVFTPNSLKAQVSSHTIHKNQ